MKILQNIKALRDWRKTVHHPVGFVPTMGALHQGHAALFSKSKSEGLVTVGSIFVNPLQFGPAEDLAKYPRTLEADLALLQKTGVDAVFVPSVEELTPQENFLTITPLTVSKGGKGPFYPHLTSSLCGKYRPGHFDGVMTIVLKLFQLVQPDRAFFGWKDAQQCVVLRKMVDEFCVPVELSFEETIREADGLAMSSRNRYLSAAEREVAPKIYRTLTELKNQILQIAESFPSPSPTEANRDLDWPKSVEKLVSVARQKLSSEPFFQVQYFEARSLKDLSPLSALPQPLLVAVAVFVSENSNSHKAPTRLIDNCRIEF